MQTLLAIEEVRFRERLLTRFDVADDALNLAVPPLVLQPLVENAVKHGVAHLVEGGEVTVRAHKRDGLLELVGRESVRPRAAAITWRRCRPRQRALAHRHLFAHRASVDVNAQPTWFRVADPAARGAGDF